MYFYAFVVICLECVVPDGAGHKYNNDQTEAFQFTTQQVSTVCIMWTLCPQIDEVCGSFHSQFTAEVHGPPPRLSLRGPAQEELRDNDRNNPFGSFRSHISYSPIPLTELEGCVCWCVSECERKGEGEGEVCEMWCCRHCSTTCCVTLILPVLAPPVWSLIKY